MDLVFTQQMAIIGYLKKYPDIGITSFEAFEKLNMTKLTTRISELRRLGYVFRVIKEKTDDATFNRYFLESEPERRAVVADNGGGQVHGERVSDNQVRPAAWDAGKLF